ncbi:MAG TPA: hypothetical protein VLV83_15675 [Acidobacteriota bacterium]|nr:hypothetical protein [Acidobacteriota bacterium]
MEWEHKGIKFSIETEKMGPFVMVSAKAPKQGMFVRVRPFSALGRDQEQALELLKNQIRLEFRRLPSPVSGESAPETAASEEAAG